MTQNLLLDNPPDPRDVYLKPAEVLARYDWRKTYGYRMLASTGFPPAIGARYRLDTLLAWDACVLSGDLPGRPDPVAKRPAEGTATGSSPVLDETAPAAVETITAPARRRTRGTRRDA